MENKVRNNSKNLWFKEEPKPKLCKEMLRDYCSHSSLHGIGYIGSKETTIPEKIVWLIIVLASLSFCSYLITMTWIRWKNNPVILNFEKEQRPIWSIPFPSITICPANKVRHSHYNYSDYFLRRDNLTGDEYKKFWDISLTCNLHQYLTTFFCSINTTDEEAISNIRDVAPRLRDTIHYSLWQNKLEENLFEEHYNKEGLCFTFNSLSQDDMYKRHIDFASLKIKHKIRTSQWTMEDGYESYLDMDAYPRRTAQDGHNYGLKFSLVSFPKDIDYVCGLPIEGYKIILHNPVETAKAAQQFLMLGLERRATIMIKPELITTNPELKSLSPHERKCYFSYEKILRFFKVYTQNNCLIECNANVTEKYCGCVPFYLPRSENTKICGFGKSDCLQEIESKILLFGLLEKSPDPTNKEMHTEEYKIFDKCDCIAACNDLQYSAEMSHTNIYVTQSLKAANLWNIIPKDVRKHLDEDSFSLTQVDIFFKESNFLALTRSDLYSKNDFVAACGGLLGLFLGFSLLSLVEIFYFLTLRMWCKIRKMKYK